MKNTRLVLNDGLLNFEEYEIHDAKIKEISIDKSEVSMVILLDRYNNDFRNDENVYAKLSFRSWSKFEYEINETVDGKLVNDFNDWFYNLSPNVLTLSVSEEEGESIFWFFFETTDSIRITASDMPECNIIEAYEPHGRLYNNSVYAEKRIKNENSSFDYTVVIHNAEKQ